MTKSHDVHSLSHTKWNCKYQIVFAPKYRRKVFFGQKRYEIGQILRELCRGKEVRLLEAEWLNKYEDHNLVIGNSNGSYKDPKYFSYKIFKRLLAKTGIPPNVRFHDLRHTHATWLLEKGVHPKVVAERLGHSSIRITLDTYSHVIKGMQQVAVSKLDEIEDGW